MTQHFALHFGEIGGKFRSFEVITQADDKHDAASKEADARIHLPPGEWQYIGAVYVPESEVERVKQSFPSLGNT